MSQFAERTANALSFGQQRLVEIARTLISEPKIVLMDEPAVGLSANRLVELDTLLRRIRDEKGVTLIHYRARDPPGHGRMRPGNRAEFRTPHRRRATASRSREPDRSSRPTWERSSVLDVKHLKVAYGMTEVLCDVSFSIPARSIVALLGGNGSGKTTLLNTLVGMVRPAAGRRSLMASSVRAGAGRNRPRGNGAGPAGARSSGPNMTVMDNLELGAATRRDWPAIRADVSEMLELFPRLVPHRRRLAGSLSGGEQQMLAIGRALMARPRYLLMDEPSAGLAPTVVADMVDTILALNKRGLTILIVEQNIGVAAAVAEHAHILQNGEIAFSGPAPGLIDNPAVLQSYLGG